jgi:hypothetical protein
MHLPTGFGREFLPWPLFRKCAGRAPSTHDHVHLTLRQIGRQRVEPVVATFAPAIFNHQILAFDIAAFTQAFAQRGHIG